MDKPKLRNLEIFPVMMQGRRMLCLRDPLGFAGEPVFIPYNLLEIVQFFDGNHSILDIQVAYTRKHGGLLFSDNIRKLIAELDDKLMMDSERFQQYQEKLESDFRDSPLRVATHAGGTYESEPEKLKAQLDEYFEPPKGPGLPDKDKQSNSLVAAIAPHIDLRRGGACFAHTYKQIAEESDAELFIILGVNHFWDDSFFIATKKSFETPLGVLNTDIEFVEALAQKSNFDLFSGELAHKQEHSIEFQVVFLQHIFSDERQIKIVPILCSSFHKMIEEGISPTDVPEVNDFIQALKETIAQSGRKICLIAGVDFSHVGRRFGDQNMLSPGLLKIVEAEDLEVLKNVEAVDAEGFYRSIQKENDRFKICGLPSIYTMLCLLEGTNGKLFKYEQSVENDTQSVVSYASVCFYNNFPKKASAFKREDE